MLYNFLKVVKLLQHNEYGKISKKVEFLTSDRKSLQETQSLYVRHRILAPKEKKYIYCIAKCRIWKHLCTVGQKKNETSLFISIQIIVQK